MTRRESDSCRSATAAAADLPTYLPARMLNEFAYCPRLFYLEWVQGEFRDSADTVEGRWRHRNVDEERGNFEGTEPERIHARSVHLSSERHGLTARIDLLELGEGEARPVDYKRGKVPKRGPYEPERVQLCAHALILRDHGFRCDEGILYFVGSKKRVPVPIDDELVSRTCELTERARETAASGHIPPPLADSPKCPRCSLVGICLPDEVRALSEPSKEAGEARRLFPARDDAQPVYVQEQGARVGKRDERLYIESRQEPGQKVEVRLLDVSQLCLFGNPTLSQPALRALAQRNVPICHYSYGGWLEAVTVGLPHKNVELRIHQFRTADDDDASLAIARRIVVGKIRNSRTLLRRNHPATPAAALEELERLARRARVARRAQTLLGIEGAAARTYFAHFAGMLKPPGDSLDEFDFRSRNRRPPRDPVNAMLSFVYALLVKDLLLQVHVVGFDPYLGFYHRPRYGRPALALDLSEEFRPIVAESVVVSAINNGELQADAFVRRGEAVALTPAGRRKLIQAYERRVDTLVRHPVLGYSASYRRIYEVQARLLGRHVLGELPAYTPFRTR